MTAASDQPTATDFEQPFTVWRWVRDRCDWPALLKCTYLMLYSRRGEGADPYPGIRRLAKDVGLGVTAVVKAVRQLEEIGALKVAHRVRKATNSADTNLYALVPPWEARASVAKVRRGRHAAGVLSKREQVLSKQEQGALQARVGVLSKREQNKPMITNPMKEPMKDNAPRLRGRKSDNPKLSQDASSLVTKLDALRKEHGLAGVGNWGKETNIAKAALADNIPVDQAITALEWGFEDSYWRQALLAGGLKALPSVWAAWRERDKPRKAKNAYRDPATNVRYDEKGSVWP